MGTLGFTAATSAAETAAQPAKLVVYRADEAAKTRQLNFHVRLDRSRIGKLEYGEAIVTSLAPGKYNIGTSLRGSGTLDIELKPGQTYFVFSRVDSLGTRVTPVLELVEEQVAVSHQPAISTVI
jgi:hypothetical protein